MIQHTTKLVVPYATAEQFYDFMIEPDNKRYQEWFPEEHLAFCITKFGNAKHLNQKSLQSRFENHSVIKS